MAICFYRANEEPYGCFSNFSRHPITVDGVTWPTSEHYFQGMKFPHDPERQKLIRTTPSPMQAKRVAWAGDAVVRPDWDRIRDQVMLTAVRAKFRQHPDLATLLLATGEETLVEHTANDHYWGDGGDGSGRNRLGATLMQVRAELRAGVA